MTEGRRLYSTRSKWELQFDYSRAVRQGNVIRVSGTAGLDEDGNPVPGGAAAQTRRALQIIERALKELGASFAEVVMTRIDVKDMADIVDVAVIHPETFSELRPAATIIQAGLVDPQIRMELEMESLLGGTR